ncbi:MAG TPA: DNA integrity scanning protein DisA nucleotide-binding domain protein, partial [Bacillota bacterium]
MAETGIPLDSLVSVELLVNLFVPSTPLHDGAVIVRGDRVVAAGCFLPLTEQRDLDTQLGSRHRA